MNTAVESPTYPFLARKTLCMAGATPGLATHAGDEDFFCRLRKHYKSTESNLVEQLIHFKAELAALEGEAFWTKVLTGLTELCHAQYSFVSKRVLVDDEKTAVEMPRIGEKGSCLMAMGLYYNDGHSIKGLHHDYKYYAWSCPCAYMKHDKVFLIPDSLSAFIADNPNSVPFEPEAYLGVPLFAEAKCFAHFGMMWTKEGLAKKTGLSWAFIEMFMHSLEDMITQKLLAGETFAKPVEKAQNESTKLIPQSAISATQSLKLYARSLSHELRTPMQGVVGMLDLMYATVQEQIEGHGNSRIRQIFQNLRDNIEVVQDSSKRAIEAADNVVHAYDLNMQVPDTPCQDTDSPVVNGGSYFESKPSMIEGSKIINPSKRKREYEQVGSSAQPTKIRHVRESPWNDFVPSNSPTRNLTQLEDVSPTRRASLASPDLNHVGTIAMPKPQAFLSFDVDGNVSTPGFRQSNIREALPMIINDAFRVGGRPDFAISEPTLLGERIEVKTRSSNGHSSSQIVTWSVEADVPYMLPFDEREMSKLISAVFLNAIKFTENGEIDIHVQLSNSKRSVLINIADTGMGIPKNFQPELFKAFSKEDGSITRSSEGLGLGLMVAKGLARKSGGDINLVRTATEGPQQGSEFEIRLPLDPSDASSRSTTPFRQTGESSARRSIAPTSATSAAQPPVTSPQFKETSPLEIASPCRVNTASKPFDLETDAKELQMKTSMHRRVSSTPKMPSTKVKPDRRLAEKYPLTFLVAEDNKINRKLLVQMLGQLGYKNVLEAFDGKEAVRIMDKLMKDKNSKRKNSNTISQAPVDVILMDLWMPGLDGYQATQKILEMFDTKDAPDKSIVPLSDLPPTVLAVSADVTDEAIERATKVGMTGYMSKPYKVIDLQKLILEFCVARFGPHLVLDS